MVQAGTPPHVDDGRAVRRIAGDDHGAGAAVHDRPAGLPDAVRDAGDDAARCGGVPAGGAGGTLRDPVARGAIFPRLEAENKTAPRWERTGRRSQALGLSHSPHRLRLRASLVPTRRAVLISGKATLGGGLGPLLHFAVVRRPSQNAPLAHRFNPLLKQRPCLSRLRPPPFHPQGRRVLSLIALSQGLADTRIRRALTH